MVEVWGKGADNVGVTNFTKAKDAVLWLTDWLRQFGCLDERDNVVKNVDHPMSVKELFQELLETGWDYSCVCDGSFCKLSIFDTISMFKAGKIKSLVEEIEKIEL